jgi:hypothetical protein
MTPLNTSLRSRICSNRQYEKEPRMASNSSGRFTGSERSITASTRPKIAVFAPIPSASVARAITVNPGYRTKDRNAYRISRLSASNQATIQASREYSVISVVFPIFRLALRSAVSWLYPSRSWSAVNMS